MDEEPTIKARSIQSLLVSWCPRYCIRKRLGVLNIPTWTVFHDSCCQHNPRWPSECSVCGTPLMHALAHFNHISCPVNGTSLTTFYTPSNIHLLPTF